MENQPQQITEYITGLLRQGYPEATIRSHLQQHGWHEQAINDAFAGLNLPAEHSSITATQQLPHQEAPVISRTSTESDKSYVVAWVLSFLVGGLGVDRFYLGHTVSGIVKLVTAGGLGIWTILDFILIAFGGLKDNRGVH